MIKPIRILLIEDNQADILLVREALREHHVEHELFIARDSDQAFTFISRMGAAADAPCPDLILLDLNIPKGSGEDVLASFRKHVLCSLTPVIIVTSSNAAKDRERATELGAARYFRKPSDLIEFLELGAVVREVASGRGLAQEE